MLLGETGDSGHRNEHLLLPMQGRRAAQTTFCLWQTFLELRSIYSKVRGHLKCGIVSPLSISKSVTSEWLLVSTLHRVGSREVCAFGLAGQEGREDFLPPPHRTRGKRFLPALRSQTLVAAPPGGNSEQLPGTQRGGLELTEGRSWAITWGAGEGGVTSGGNRLQSDPPAGCCHEEYTARLTRYFRFLDTLDTSLLEETKT